MPHRGPGFRQLIRHCVPPVHRTHVHAVNHTNRFVSAPWRENPERGMPLRLELVGPDYGNGKVKREKPWAKVRYFFSGRESSETEYRIEAETGGMWKISP
jgi:hypothetical protein